MDKKMEETLHRLRLRRKYSCVVIQGTPVELGMLKHVKDLVAYGELDQTTFTQLVEARGQIVDKKKKIDFKKAAEEISKGKKYEEFNLKPFFRLHPARGGIDSKVHYPRGVLGNHGQKINELVKRML